MKLKHRVNIFAMYLSPRSGGKGIGRALMNVVLKKAHELDGIEQVYLSV
ncbi:GNAT family N-acetyltransferase [Cytobacillus sp. IB215316]|nr:GNAT family N-acetyltransferase [Cytobacillus sp. IB215316]MDX8361432.1 GNAT family N-acetyltransferase [Cytobacillus sp. IB215316]